MTADRVNQARLVVDTCPAVKVGVGGVDAITGNARNPALHAEPQDYMVVPNQPWLDGIKAGEGIIRQFVAAPLGEGVTVEAQVTGEESLGGRQLTIVGLVRRDGLA